MLKIRLTRRGKKNRAFFRLVVAEHSSPVKGRFVEALGFLNPHTKEKKFEEEKIKYWLGKGAQCSVSAHNLLVADGIIAGPKKALKIRKKAEGDAEEKTEEKKTELEGQKDTKDDKEQGNKEEKDQDEGKAEEGKREEKEADKKAE